MTSFLYPSLGPPPSTGLLTEAGDVTHIADVLDELAATVRSTWSDAMELDRRTLKANRDRLVAAGDLIRTRLVAGGTILMIGNGGSACDADRLVRLLKGTAPARSLLDPAVMSALANDVGAPRMFARQVETFATASDVVVVFSTSGTSANVVAALAAARRAGAGTIAFAGYGGAALAESSDVDVCLRVDSTSVHRIQEAQAALSSELVAQLAKAVT